MKTNTANITETKTSHTPGPWINAIGHLVIADQKGVRLAVADCNTATILPFETLATNARLIAAAPELLAACQAGLNALSCVSKTHKEAPVEGCDCYACDVANEMKAAIAKATNP